MAPPESAATRSATAAVLLRHRSTQVLLVSIVPLAMARGFMGGPGWRDIVAAISVALLWPGFEWLLHVAMHSAPFVVGRWRIDPESCRAHRRHHVDPGVVDDLLLPPGFFLVTALVAWTALPLLFGLGLGWTVAIAFHLGGLLNGWVHLLTHTRVRPWSRYYTWVRRNHHLHHFKNHRRWFAFTGPWLDGRR